ncbi:MAG: hypothetical protein JRI23_26260, partial [Deltaproteobacteria bacterium]|jgi:serine/threonine protein kinase|nr:hypothetical protein [Deltaproteobacteria bacterium]MBW2535540.1 hypothetical protein [Deltaproteobacteria bacterium]
VDASADIWAFCVVLYELVTGKLPFTGKNMLALLRSIVEDAAPTVLDHGIDDPELAEILDKGLQKEPAHRWQSMGELGKALAGLLLDRGVQHDVSGIRLEAVWFEDRSVDTKTDVFSSAPPSEAAENAPVVVIPSHGAMPDARALAATQPSLDTAPEADLLPPATPPIIRGLGDDGLGTSGDDEEELSSAREPASQRVEAQDDDEPDSAIAPAPASALDPAEQRRIALQGFMIIAAAILIVGVLAIAAWVWISSRQLPASPPTPTQVEPTR